MVNKRMLIGALLVVVLLMTSGWFAFEHQEGEELVIATTTSTYDSGLLEEIISDFEEVHDARVKINALGTGQAMELGRRGDADVLLVHAPEMEQEFVDEGYGIERKEVMYNEFVVVGPEDDPAGIGGSEDVEEVFQSIYENKDDDLVEFYSRGDDSGTHMKEKDLWEESGYDYNDIDSEDQSDWYKSLGQGMGDTLRACNDKEGYALTDESTFISLNEEISELEVLFRGDEKLFNQYGVIPVDGEIHPSVNQELGEKFAEWITSERVQDMIDDYALNGEKLFTPNADD